MVGIVRVEVLRQRQRGKVEGATTQGLLEGLEVLRVTPPWSEQRSNFSRKTRLRARRRNRLRGLPRRGERSTVNSLQGR